METNQSISDANRAVEFYLPGTFQFARAPGRIERFLTRHFHGRDAAVATAVVASAPEHPLPEPTGIVR